MSISKEKTRLQITLGNELLAKMDDFCDRTGITRSAYITYVIGSNLDQYDALTKAAAKGIAEAAKEK